MSKIDRKGWKKITFGEVCSNVNATVRNPADAGIERYVGLEHIEPGSLQIKSWGNVADGTTFTKGFKPGQVLFGKRRAYQKKAAVATFAGLCSGDILVLEPNEELIDKNLFPFLVASDGFFDYAVQTSAGSLSPRTKFQDLANYEFLLPPKDQQARIVELLWAADDVVQKYEEVKGMLEKVKSSYHFEKFNTEKYLSINDITIKVGSGKTPLGGEKVYVKKGVIFLRSQNVLNGELSLDDVVYIDELTNNSMKSTSVQYKDVLLNITGASIGRCAVYDLKEEANVNQHVCIIRSKTYSSIVLCEYLNSRFGQEQINTLQTGGNRQGLNFQNLKQFQIPYFNDNQMKKVENGIVNIINQKALLRRLLSNSKLIQKQLINQVFG